jgi:hypothetical protein
MYNRVEIKLANVFLHKRHINTSTARHCKIKESHCPLGRMLSPSYVIRCDFYSWTFTHAVELPRTFVDMSRATLRECLDAGDGSAQDERVNVMCAFISATFQEWHKEGAMAIQNTSLL